MIVAGQPDGAPSWFPCNDRPNDKASYRITISAESAYPVVANGRLVDKQVGGSRTTWIYDQPQPMSTYLATVQIGRYVEWSAHGSAVPVTIVAPPSRRRVAEHDLGRQVQMLEVFQQLFGPYPFAGYTAVVTDDDLEIPLEAQGLSIFGANHVDGQSGSERLVAHELAHQWFGNSLTVGPVAGHLAARGLRLLRRVAVGRACRRPAGRCRRARGVGAAGRAPAGPRARRPGAGADVRRPALQARRPAAARVARHRRRRLLLRRAAWLDGSTPARVGQHARCSWRTWPNAPARRRPRRSSPGSTSRLCQPCRASVAQPVVSVVHLDAGRMLGEQGEAGGVPGSHVEVGELCHRRLTVPRATPTPGGGRTAD